MFGINKCEMCSKVRRYLYDHHVIPWRFSHDDSDSNIMRVCGSCHNKADSNFVSLIMYGEMNISKDTHIRTSNRYCKKYIKHKILFQLKLFKHARYRDIVVYNTRTDNICISRAWDYYKCRIRGIKSYPQMKRLKRYANAKGQSTLTAYGV